MRTTLRTRVLPGSVALAVALLTPIAARAQASARAVTEESAGLLARARVTPESARRIALGRVPTGAVKSAEIEVENGLLVYSFDIAVPKKSGIEEIQVNALTGVVVSHEHETPAAERAEKASEARSRRSAAVPKPPTR